MPRPGGLHHIITAMTATLALLAGIAALAWLYLLVFHHGFWRADQRLPRDLRGPRRWPSVAAVVPARNEARLVGQAVESLLGQDYKGVLSVIVVDDHSGDETARVARSAARAFAKSKNRNFHITAARPLAAGWTGKLSAMARGAAAAGRTGPRYILFTDADIAHDPGNLRRLVAKAEKGKLDLVSLMVRLHCRGAIERLLVPAFVFFFQKLYPFPASNDPKSRIAAAAGGCMLVRREALADAGGLAAIKGALIDDCALARLLKRNGPIWLGLADDETRSLRPYDGLKGFWAMVARSAYAQLGHSPPMLLGAVLGMLILYVIPVAALVWGILAVVPALAFLGVVALAAMLLAYWPTRRLYDGFSLTFLGLPLAALLYTAMTLDSGLRHRRGRGGGWKGRTYPAPTRDETGDGGP